ncbi:MULTISPECIES: MFS transporter [Streptomyces]|uniref:Purine ribonucleoside efflux pump NepI n=1 Tax=Streptomyces chartreusis NRRL 3882 TaxID=1079985 RepID=A0A2N9BEJ4_STRCX|nr:MFS transporter [Streptomyces chartreusis]SOR81798.1 Purine ribonucleoside efflux pump NepI [Streptomyces chartreusis NRRL 3882]
MPSTSSPSSMTTVPETGTGRTARPWPAVLALATATFSVVTTEMLPVGLLTSLGTGLHVSAGTAGLAVTLPGLVAAASAPLLPVAARRADRRTVLCALLILLAAANVLSALAPHIAVLLLARALVGVCIGGVWAIAAGLGTRLVAPDRAGRATALIFSGIAVASVLGVPAGTLLGSLAGWRWAFAALAVLAVAVAGALALALPPLPPERPVRLGTFPALLRTPVVSGGLLATALLVTGHFTAYTYVRPVLERVPGLGAGTISTLLLGYGLAGVAGTFAGGWLAARDPRRALLVIAAGLGTVVLLMVPAAGSLAASTLLLVVWGLVYGGVSVSAQNWLSAAAPRAREAGSALFAGVFNTGIALGAFTGGRVADALGPTAVLCVGGGLALLALPAVVRAGRPGAGAARRPDTAGAEDPGARA